MITPLLEKQILNGNGNFRVFSAGGMGKSNLPVPNDRFFVITKLIIYPFMPHSLQEIGSANNQGILERCVFQVNILTGQQQIIYPCRFNFQAGYDTTDNIYKLTGLGEPVTIDTYIVCQSDVSIVFISPAQFGITTLSTGRTDARAQGISPSVGYGREGIPNSFQADLTREFDFNSNQIIRQNEFETGGITQGDFVRDQFNIPVDDTTVISTVVGQNQDINNNYQYPICNIEYVDIFGLPTNLQ